jgi:hypothetical protein
MGHLFRCDEVAGSNCEPEQGSKRQQQPPCHARDRVIVEWSNGGLDWVSRRSRSQTEQGPVIAALRFGKFLHRKRNRNSSQRTAGGALIEQQRRRVTAPFLGCDSGPAVELSG